ncbi:MAG: dual specificity protein phosphatase family protein, partial [Myxococcaceae bacterium]
TAAKITRLNLSGCGLTDTLTDLTRFTGLKVLNISENKLTALEEVPSSLEQLLMSNNHFATEPDLSGLTHLVLVDARFNQLTAFPDNIYRRLQENYSEDHDHPRLELIGNPITEFPDFMTGAVLVTIDNFPDFASMHSVQFSNLYPNEILKDQLYLGAIEHLNKDILRDLGVSQVVNCANDEYVMQAANELLRHGLTMHNLFLDDANNQAIDLRSAALIVHGAISAGLRVMINCRQGISRSATVTLAYLILHQNMSLLEALGLVREKRPKIGPNPGFMSQLVDLAVEINPQETRTALIEDIEIVFGLKAQIGASKNDDSLNNAEFVESDSDED